MNNRKVGLSDKSRRRSKVNNPRKNHYQDPRKNKSHKRRIDFIRDR